MGLSVSRVKPASASASITTASGASKLVELEYVAIEDEQDDLERVLVIVRDVTELRKRDRLLLSKDATIREIHHRVKNNFQLISSLIRLQSRAAAGTEATELLQSLAGRIQAMALAHERFYRDKDVAQVNLRDFLIDLGNEVQRAFVPEDQEINIRVEVADTGAGMPPDRVPALFEPFRQALAGHVDRHRAIGV